MATGARASRWTLVATFAVSLLVLGYRGSAARGWVMYLDDVFVQHAVYSDVEYSGLRALLDPLGVFRSFSGYLHIVARLGASVFSWIGLGSLPLLVWSSATLIWAGCATLIAWAVSTSTGRPVAGLVAGTLFALAPSSNIILLGQLNALQWPMLAAGTVVAVSGARPATRFGRVGLATFLVALVLNAALSFLVLAILAVRAWRGAAATAERRLLVAPTLVFLPQIYAYANQEARAVESHSLGSLANEFAYAFHTFVPSVLRWPYGGDATATHWLAAIAWWMIVAGALVWAGRLVDRPTRLRVGAYLTTAFVFLALSVAMNGNLNHQYLVVPTICLIVAAIEAVAASRSRVPAVAFALAFGVAAVGLLPRNLDDSFFGQPYVGNWRSALAEARSGCSATNDVVSVPGTSRPLRIPCARR